jgi:integrase
MRYWVKLFPPGDRSPFYTVRGRDVDGRFEHSTGQRSSEGAEEWVQTFLAERSRRRTPVAGETVGFATAAQHYKAARPHLDRGWIKAVDAVAAEIGELDCKLVTHATIVAAAHALKPGAEDGTKNSSVMAPAIAVLHYAAENKWCEYKRFSKFKVSRKSTRQPASDETMRTLLANPMAERKFKFGHRADFHFAHKKLLLAFLYELGLRITDNLEIEWPHIDLQGAKVKVRIHKTDDWATLTISPAIVAMLATLPNQAGYLFPWRTRSGVYRWLKPLCERLGVTYTPHLSRHALATAADAALIPDKRAALLGVWRDVRSLQRYQHVRPDAIPGRTVDNVLATNGGKSVGRKRKSLTP